MDFSGTKPIFLQIVDFVNQNIISLNWSAGDRIPSVRDFAKQVNVNPNTIIHSYNYLQEKGIIYNKRGIGYFVCDDAVKLINEYRKAEFVTNELPETFKMIDLLGISFPELMKFYIQFKKNEIR